MPIEADHHLHTPLCKHAAGPLEAYVERAIELGLRQVGFADHNPLPDGRGDNVRMAEAELDYYVQRIEELRFRYRGRIEVLLGIELDYIPELEGYLSRQVSQYPWDFVIGAIHYHDPDCRIGSWSEQAPADPRAHLVRYFSLVRQLCRSGLADVIAHLDVPKRAGVVASDWAADELAITLDEIARCGCCLEINTSGYRHVELPQPQPYPAWDIIAQALARGIPLQVNSDAHAPEQVGLMFATVGAMLRRHGCRRLSRFHRRQREDYPL